MVSSTVLWTFFYGGTRRKPESGSNRQSSPTDAFSFLSFFLSLKSAESELKIEMRARVRVSLALSVHGPLARADPFSLRKYVNLG